MSSLIQQPFRRRFLPLFLAALVPVLAAPRLLRSTAAHAAAVPHASTLAMAPGMSMSQDAMRTALERFYAAHPQHVSAPLRVSSLLDAPADSFLAINFAFEEDGNSATQVDTARIQAGQSILFKWGVGVHTVTSGTGSTDPNVGQLFDHSMRSTADNFSVVFPSAGTFPFFCRIHELSNMKGVVLVSASAAVPPSPLAAMGFVAPLAPNPATRGVSFRIALARPGHARVEVFDAEGRHVATPLDGEFAAGTFSGAWNGLDARGDRVSPGVYLVRLRAPGIEQARSLVYTR